MEEVGLFVVGGDGRACRRSRARVLGQSSAGRLVVFQIAEGARRRQRAGHYVDGGGLSHGFRCLR